MIGTVADYVAAAAVFAIGAWMLPHGDGEEEKAGRLATARGAALIGLGVCIMDELAIGFGFGLVHLPLVPVIVGIAVQAFVAAQLRLRQSPRIAERFREAAERVAGVVLIIMGVVLASEQLLG